MAVVMKHAAPTSSPYARPVLPDDIAAKDEKLSGAPFSRTSKVTPAKVSLMRRLSAIEPKFTEKKSPAAMPIVVNKIASHGKMMKIAPASHVEVRSSKV